MRSVRNYLGQSRRLAKARYYQRILLRNVQDINQLVEIHFRFWSNPDHISKAGIKQSLANFSGRNLDILETGSSAWGTDSTRLFDSYVRIFGGTFKSVDLRDIPRKKLANQLCSQTHLYVGDSVEFISNLKPDEKFDFVYLDSFDVDWLNPGPSALHGLHEMQEVIPHLKAGAIVIIDDTPFSVTHLNSPEFEVAQKYKKVEGVYPGKGALIPKYLKENNIPHTVISHQYNLVIRFN